MRPLLQHEELGDRKPSQLLRYMRDLLGSTLVDDSLLRIICLQRQPSHAQAILQVQLNLPLDQLSHIADQVVEISLPASPLTINAIDTRQFSSELARRVDEITRQLVSIQRRVDQSPKLHPQNAPKAKKTTPLHRTEMRTAPATTIAASGTKPRNVNHLAQLDVRETSTAARNTAASYQLRGRRIFVTDQVTKRRFVVDCDSDMCCFPRTFLCDKRPCTSFELSVANHSTIKTYGSLRLNINFKNLRQDFP
nr:uncharacterized protein LOC119176428 [Rhipicephalus microplus]